MTSPAGYLPELGINSCVWVNNSSCWAEGGVPGGNWTRGCRTAAQRTNHWAALHPIELRCTLLSCAAPSLSCAAPYGAAVHPTELRCTLLSCAAPYWAALHPSELRCTPINVIPTICFHLNRVRNGNEDISSEKHFENSKTRRGSYLFTLLYKNLFPKNISKHIHIYCYILLYYDYLLLELFTFVHIFEFYLVTQSL